MAKSSYLTYQPNSPTILAGMMPDWMFRNRDLQSLNSMEAEEMAMEEGRQKLRAGEEVGQELYRAYLETGDVQKALAMTPKTKQSYKDFSRPEGIYRVYPDGTAQQILKAAPKVPAQKSSGGGKGKVVEFINPQTQRIEPKIVRSAEEEMALRQQGMIPLPKDTENFDGSPKSVEQLLREANARYVGTGAAPSPAPAPTPKPRTLLDEANEALERYSGRPQDGIKKRRAIAVPIR